jgi:hypothetical protein
MGEKGDKGKCEKPAGHKVHMCKLKKEGKRDEMDLHEQNSIVYCKKCNAKADDPSYLCNPRALKEKH